MSLFRLTSQHCPATLTHSRMRSKCHPMSKHVQVCSRPKKLFTITYVLTVNGDFLSFFLSVGVGVVPLRSNSRNILEKKNPESSISMIFYKCYQNPMEQLLKQFQSIISSYGLFSDNYWRCGLHDIHDF